MTALQELIEIIKNKRKESDISNTLLRFCQVEAEKLLKREEEQVFIVKIILDSDSYHYKKGDVLHTVVRGELSGDAQEKIMDTYMASQYPLWHILEIIKADDLFYPIL